MSTRADIEATLVSRIGAWLVNAGLNGTTVNGTNASLNDAIGYGIRVAAGTVTSPALVTDTDVASVATASYYLMIDAAELRALESVLGNFTLVDAKAGPVEAKSSQFIDYVKARIAALRESIALTYGIGGGGTLTQVPVTYGAAATDEFARPPNYWP